EKFLRELYAYSLRAGLLFTIILTRKAQVWVKPAAKSPDFRRFAPRQRSGLLMRHLSVFRRWARTARQLRLALVGLTLLFVTLVLSTLDFALQLNRYTIASSQHALQNTARSCISMLDSYLERQMSYVQRAATAIASLPEGSG